MIKSEFESTYHRIVYLHLSVASSLSRDAGWCPGAMTTAVETAAASKINCKVSRSPTWVESEVWPKAIINAIHTHLISWQSHKDPQKFKRCDWLPTVSCANDSVLFGWISLDFWNMHPCFGVSLVWKTIIATDAMWTPVCYPRESGLREPFGMFHHHGWSFGYGLLIWINFWFSRSLCIYIYIQYTSPFKFVHLGMQWLNHATFDWHTCNSILLHAGVMSKELADTQNLEVKATWVNALINGTTMGPDFV